MKRSKRSLQKRYKKLVKKFQKTSRRFHHRHTHRKTVIVLTLLIASALFAGFFFINTAPTRADERLVTFHDRGEDRVILTRATTVRAALHNAGITVANEDLVEPAIDSQLLSTDSAVIIYRARLVLVIDGALRQKVLTPKQSPNEIALAAGMATVSSDDTTAIREGNLVADDASEVLTIERQTPPVVLPVKEPTTNPLTSARGAHVFVDSNGVAHRETYYDLPMNIVIKHCSDADYSIRYDGAKIDKEGYVLVAANYAAYPRCSIVETSLGPGKVYDTGGFALRYPHGFDLATDWTNRNGR